MGSLNKDVSANSKCKSLELKRNELIAGVIGRARHISAAPSRGFIHSQDYKGKKSKLRWLI